MPKYCDAAELKTMVEDKDVGLDGVKAFITEGMERGRTGKPGGMKSDHFSVRDLFEEFYPNGGDILRCWSKRRPVPGHLMEAADAVSTQNFSEIIGQLLVNDVLRGYEAPQLIWPQLCTTKQTVILNGEKIPGIGGLGDVAQAVGEAEEYPVVGLNQEYIETPQLVKRGFRVALTKEIVIADLTGLLGERAAGGAEYLGVNLEKRVIDAAIGVTNTYKRLGVATNTYLASGAYANYSSGNTLVDWKSIETAWLLFDALNDPNTGEPIVGNFNTMLVPSALKATAEQIVRATNVQKVDNQVAAGTVRFNSEYNPATALVPGLKVLSSPYVKRRSSSAARWWLGDFPRAFRKMTAWEITPEQQGQGSYLQFHRDIVMEHKISVMDAIAVVEPRAVTQNAS